MGNIEIFKPEYWSKSLAFLLPLTGLSRTHKYPIETFLFWDDYSIENYNLMVKFTYDNYDDFVDYCRKIVFPIWDKRGYVVESYDFGKETVFVLDISEWALDVQMFLAGKYSKFSREAKETIQEYHIFYTKGTPQIEIEIAATLEPTKTHDILEGMNSIEYVSEYYGLPLPELQKLGEIGSIYDKEKETLSYLSVNVAVKE
jgi:hypothetical protein